MASRSRKASKLKLGELIAPIMFNGQLRNVVLGPDGHHVIINPPDLQNPNYDPNHLLVDIENLGIPKDVDPKELYNLIVAGMRKRNYLGSVNATMIFAKTSEHITLDNLSQMKQFQQRDLQFYSKIPAKDTADEEIQREIDAFVEANVFPRNLFVLGGDTFFSKSFTKLKGEDKYRVLGCFRAEGAKIDTLNDAVIDSWVYRDLLGLKYEPEPEKKIQTRITGKRKKGSQKEPEKFVQNLYEVGEDETLPVLINFLRSQKESKVMVHFFNCSTVEFVVEVLTLEGVACSSIHGIKSLAENIEAYEAFKIAKSGIILCSDAVGLGPHIDTVKWIVRFDFPDNPHMYFRKVLRPTVGSGGQALMILNHGQKTVPYLFGTSVGLEFKRWKIPENIQEPTWKNDEMLDMAREAYSHYRAFLRHLAENGKLVHRAEREAVKAVSFGCTEQTEEEILIEEEEARREEEAKKEEEEAKKKMEAKKEEAKEK